MTTPTPLQQALTMLGAMYLHPPMTPERLAVFELALADLAPDAVERAFRALLNDPTRQFYPTAGEFRAAARPEPSRTEAADLLAAVHAAVCADRPSLCATLPVIEARFGLAAAHAVRAIGGLDAVRRSSIPANAPHTLKAFHEALVEAHHKPELAEQRPAITAGHPAPRVWNGPQKLSDLLGGPVGPLALPDAGDGQ